MQQSLVPAPSVPEADVLPLASLAQLYYAQLRAEGKSPGTIQTYRSAIDRFCAFFTQAAGRPPVLADYTVLAARQLLAHELERPKWAGHPTLDRPGSGQLSTATVHQLGRSLKTFGGWLEREEYVYRHPLSNLRLPKIAYRELQPLTHDEIATLLGAYGETNATDCRLRAIFALAIDTGLRLSELIGLQLEDVHFDEGFVRVIGKGNKQRSVPFGLLTERVLRKYALLYRPHPIAAEFGEFFLSPDGYPLTKKSMTMIFNRARTRTGIKRLHPHLLRHTFAMRAQEADIPTLTLQLFMGHSSSKVTERYVHAAQSERLRRARGYSPLDEMQRQQGGRPRTRGGR